MSSQQHLREKFQNFCHKFFQNTSTHFIEKTMMEKCGYWPGNSLCIWKMCVVTFFMVFLTGLPGINYLVSAARRGDSKDFALVVPEVFLEIHQTVSFVNYLLYFTVIRRFQEIFDFEWKKHSEIKEWQDLREKTAKFCNRISFFNHVNMHVTGLVYFIIPTAIFVLKYYFGLDKNVAKKTIILVDFGFNWKDSWFFHIYELLVLLSYFIITITYLLQHLYFLNSINYCAAYFELVCIKIRNLDQNLKKFSHMEAKEALKEIVQHHVIALEMSKMLQDMTRYFMLFHHLTMIAVMCFLTFLISNLQDDIMILLKIGALAVIIQIYLFLFSYYGTKLMDAGYKVGNEISLMSWNEIKQHKLQKFLILITLRSQRAIGIKAGKFFFINFKSFVEALNTIISYISVLRVLLIEKGKWKW